ncbi:MAG TPA: F0F1 ATP synthase subunit B [Burkholderiales bacterium]|jgi:F-type H+-transporting ATPase subunit b|nr:F0F1 ATP synthase subunit B [Verrucomicrobiae bacterium]HZT63473.1 F0F1 ATP synthase subunit B [Burkholderiales bacterium]
MNLIDIRMVGTQILGFLILLWGLSKWAWGPLTAQLEKRRQRIAGEFAEAERRQNAADQLKAKFEQDLRGIDAQARAKLQEAVSEGQKVAGEIRAQANSEAQARMARAEEEMMREREKAKELLKEQIIALSIATAEKILKSKLDEPAHRKLAGQFIDEVGALR